MALSTAEITAKISKLFEARAWRFKWASKFIKVGFVTFGAAIAGAAQFLQIPDGKSPSTVQLIGIAATIMAFLGSLFVLLVDDDASNELAIARSASEDLRERMDELDSLPDYEEVIERQTYLYQSAMIMRSAIERAVVTKEGIAKTLRSLLELTSRTLPVAVGLAQADRWTICIYQAHPQDSGRDRLVCVAHSRAIMCDISKARSWEEGVGVAGIAYANRQEIVVPDMHHAGLGTVFNIAAGARDYDADRYRSMTAVPVKIDGQLKPWGVVVATNDRYGHFNLVEDVGPQNVEGIRLLAGMIALAVAPTVQGATDTTIGTLAIGR